MLLYPYIDSSVKDGCPPYSLSARTRRQESAFAVLGSPKDTLFIIADKPDIFDIIRELVMQYVLIKEYR